MGNHTLLNNEYPLNKEELVKIEYDRDEMYKALKQRSKELQSTPVKWEDYYD